MKEDFLNEKEFFFRYHHKGAHYGYNFKEQYRNVQYLCHYYLNLCSGETETDGVVDFYVRNLRPKQNKAFMDWLLTPETSPWKAGLEHATVIEDPETRVPVATIFRNLKDSPIQVLSNLLIACRMRSCWGQDWTWFNFVKAGFTPEAAFILSTLFCWDNQRLTVGGVPPENMMTANPCLDKLCKAGPFSGDQPLCTTTRFFPKDFCERNPTFKPKETLYSGTGFQPCNCIWMRGAKKSNGQYLSYTDLHPKKPIPVFIIRSEKDLRGLVDCAKGIKPMSAKDILEIEDAFRNEQCIEV